MISELIKVFPFVDDRVKAVGVSFLRKLNAHFLANELGDKAFLIQDSDIPLAVLVSYQTYLKIQAEIKNAHKVREGT